jgi:hypothetical protein
MFHPQEISLWPQGKPSCLGDLLARMPKFPGTGLLNFPELQSKPATSPQLSQERVGRQLCLSPLFCRGGIGISVFLGYGEELQSTPVDHDQKLAFLRSANEALEAFLLGLSTIM